MEPDFAGAVLTNGSTLLEFFKLQLGIDPSDTSDDDNLALSLNLAGSALETYLDRVIVKREVTEYFRAYFGAVILHHFPVDTVIGVSVDHDGIVSGDYKLYQDNARQGHLTRQGWRQDMPFDWRNYDQVIVLYTAGFDPIPLDLAQALIWIAQPLYDSMGTGSGVVVDTGALKQVQLYDVGAVSYSTSSSSSTSSSAVVTFGGRGSIPAYVADSISAYKRMSV